LLTLSGGRRNYMELVKLLYLADREALIQLDRPITGDRFVNLPYGPVLSRILNLIRGGPIDEGDAPWFDSVSPPTGYDVELVKKTGSDELSLAELGILNETFSRYGRSDWKELSRLTHSLPEWVDPDGGQLPIVAEQILALGGRKIEEIQRIKEEAAACESLDKELATYRGQEFSAPSE